MWPFERSKKPGNQAPALSPVRRHTEDDQVAGYKSWSASGLALDEARATQVNDPLSNPDTVGHLRKRAYQTSIAEIDADHEARVHALTTAQRWRRVENATLDGELEFRFSERNEAVAQLRRIRAARAAHDPATAAADMVRDEKSSVTRYLVISWVGSALASIGVAASVYLAHWGLAVAIIAGLAAEACLTFLGSSIISDQSKVWRRAGLAYDHEGTRIDADIPNWARVLPWWALAGLLTASVAINIYGLAWGGTGEIGALGVAGAAASALASALGGAYSRQSSAVTNALLGDHRIVAGENALTEVASGARIPRPAPAAGRARDEREDALDAIAADPSILDQAVTESAERAAINAEIHPPTEPDADGDGGVAVAERPAQLDTGTASSKEIGDANRRRVQELYERLKDERGEAPSKSELGRILDLDRRSISRHLGN